MSAILSLLVSTTPTGFRRSIVLGIDVHLVEETSCGVGAVDDGTRPVLPLQWFVSDRSSCVLI